ncbi:MAG: hypothetical protein WA133_08835 [Syntrophales bacterium]
MHFSKLSLGELSRAEQYSDGAVAGYPEVRGVEIRDRARINLREIQSSV